MKEVLYDWGGGNVWLFHAINDIRFPGLDSIMLLGTTLGDHILFPLYLGVLALFALVVVNTPFQDTSHHRVRVSRWMAVIAVFSLAYFFDGVLLGYLKPLLDFPRPPLALPPGTLNIVGAPEYHHSLPSGHSSFAMLVTASLWPVLNRNWRIAGVVICVVGRDFQGQSRCAFPRRCDGGFPVQPGGGVAGLRCRTKVDAVC